MERDGVRYNTTTPINYKVEEEKETVLVEAGTQLPQMEQEKSKEPKKKNGGFGWKNFFNQFKDDNMFKDNEA